MATLGQQFKAAREAKGIHEHDAGLATKILTKIIIAMEADDFSGMPAPMYAKGFIRLYANYLGLDPDPLIDEYLLRHAPGRKPLMDENSPLQKKSRPPAPFSFNLKWLPANFHPKAWLDATERFFSKVGPRTIREHPIPPVKDVRILAGGIAALLVLIVLIVSISNCTRRRAAEKPPAPEPQIQAARQLLDGPLPDLYLVEPGKIESSR